MKIQKGIISILKPKRISSYGVIRKLKKITDIKKIGHAGTLDPLATGVLVVGIGKDACKKLNKIVIKEKEYLAKIKLGAFSSTDDAEGDIKINQVKKKPNIEDIKSVLNTFQGRINQKPPLYSAIKINGQPAYKLARQGKKITLKPRIVELKEVKIINYYWPYLELKLITGAGFYVRSLARDIGKKLGFGGYLFDLERTRVGNFKKENSIQLNIK